MSNHSAATLAVGDGKTEYEQPLPWILLACTWALMLITFTLPGRSGPTSAGDLDLIAMIKLGVRGVILLVLICMLLCSPDCFRRFAVLVRLSPFGLFIGWAIVSVLWSPLKTLSLGQAGGLVVLFLLAANLGVLCRGPQNTSKMLQSLSAGLLFCSFVIVAAHILFPSVGSLDRHSLGMVHPTTAAATASLGLILLVAAKQFWGWKWARTMLLPGVLIHGSLLFLAANRMSLFLSVVLLAAIVCALSDRWLISAVALLIGLAGTVYLTLDPDLDLVQSSIGTTSKYVARGNADDLTDYSGRDELWGVVWNSYRESPWIGHGYFVSSAGGELYIWYTWANWTAHNLILQALVSTGMVGTALFLLALFVPFCLLWRCRNINSHTRQMSRLAVLVMAWYSGWGLFSSSFLGPIEPESVVFFTVLGLAVGHVPVLPIARTMWTTSQSTGFGPSASTPQLAQS